MYVDGHLLVTLRGENIVAEFLGILNEYVASRYGAGEPAGQVGRTGSLL